MGGGVFSEAASVTSMTSEVQVIYLRYKVFCISLCIVNTPCSDYNKKTKSITIY